MTHSATALAITPESNREPRTWRGQQRRQKILKAATDRFLQAGYGATSIDAIVEKSGGSKATLYALFATKEDLFRAVVDQVVANASQPPLDDSQPVHETLRTFAEQRMAVVLSTHHRALLRLIAGEAERFPDIGDMYYQRGPGRSLKTLTDYFKKLKRRHQLAEFQPGQAAQFLIGMLLHHDYVRQLYAKTSPPSSGVCRRRCREVVGLFMQAYLSDLRPQIQSGD